jgi:hypothetical protein
MKRQLGVLLVCLAATGGAVVGGALPGSALPLGALLPDPQAASTGPLPAAPANLDFEQGELGEMPPGWRMTQASASAGFGAQVTDDRPYQGRTCALVNGISFSRTPLSGTLMQSFDATAYRGKRVRFRAAVRAENSRAQLWLAVERPRQLPGFFDNMADRPITAGRWQVYEVVGDVAADAARIGIGLTLNGDGRAWIDAGSFDVLGPAGAGAEPPRPLRERGLANLIALARLVGYVRYFHPSDEAAQANWGAFTAAAVATLDSASPALPPPRDGASLAAALQRLFEPLAPTLKVFPTGGRPPALDLRPPATGTAASGLEIVGWRHIGLGASGGPSLFSSMRVRGRPGQATVAGLDPRAAPLAADLGGGASCLLPLALWADDAGTLPQHQVLPAARAAGGAAPRLPDAAAAPATLPLSPDDRNARLAIVILAWNVLQHFHPGLPEAGAHWQEALPAALREAASSAGLESLLAVSRRLAAATGDGQATVSAAADSRVHPLPLRWDWIEGQLVVTAVGAGAGGLHAGDAVVRIDGRDAGAELREVEARTAAATPQWRRWRALQSLALGARGESLRLGVESTSEESGAGRQGGAGGGAGATGASPAAPLREVTVPYGAALAGAEARLPQPEAVREPSPGVLVVDLGRLTEAELGDALPRLAKAAGIVFDLRGYVRSTDLLLSHLIAAPLSTRRELVPIWGHPDRAAPLYNPSETQLLPATPPIRGRLAFLSAARDIGAAESFLAVVAELRLGAIVGAPTGGAGGTVDSAPLPGGFSLIWTATRPAPGAPPAGTPVQPTLPAAPTRRGLAAGRDEVLEQALAIVTPQQPTPP